MQWTASKLFESRRKVIFSCWSSPFPYSCFGCSPHSFRDLLHEEYKSSSKAKFTKRMKSRSSSTESFNRDTAASPDVQRSTSNQKSTSNTQSRSSIHDNANGLFVSHSPVHSSLVTHEMTASLPWPREDDGTTTSSPSPPPRRSMRESFVPPEWSSKLPSRQPENTSLSLPQPMYQGSSSSPSVLHRDLPIEEGQHSGRIGFLSAAASTLNRGSAFSIPYQPRNTSRGSMDVTSRLHSGSSPQSLNAEALQYGSKNEVARPNGEDIFRMIWGVSSTDNAAPKEFQPADATSSDAFEETAPSSPKVLAHPDGSPKVLLAGSAYELLYEPPTAQHPDLGNASIGSFDLSSHSTRAQNGNPQPKIHSSSSDESPRGHR